VLSECDEWWTFCPAWVTQYDYHEDGNPQTRSWSILICTFPCDDRYVRTRYTCVRVMRENSRRDAEKNKNKTVKRFCSRYFCFVYTSGRIYLYRSVRVRVNIHIHIHTHTRTMYISKLGGGPCVCVCVCVCACKEIWFFFRPEDLPEYCRGP